MKIPDFDTLKEKLRKEDEKRKRGRNDVEPQSDR